jgi:hypothetical protein
MATFTAIKSRTTGGMGNVLDYVSQEKKALCDEWQLVTGLNCVAQSTYTEMRTTKQQELPQNKVGTISRPGKRRALTAHGGDIVPTLDSRVSTTQTSLATNGDAGMPSPLPETRIDTSQNPTQAVGNESGYKPASLELTAPEASLVGPAPTASSNGSSPSLKASPTTVDATETSPQPNAQNEQQANTFCGQCIPNG